MATAKDTSTFFLEADAKEFDSVLKLYPQALKLKAEQKTKKPEELVKLDNWYQNELPKKIKSRGKDAHMIHEELVQLMKWKQARGRFYPQLSYLIKVNTPRAVMQETKKAFRKLPNIESAMTALSNLKGVGTATASALLAAASPDTAPFMADECLQAIPAMEGSDYTAKEYLNFVNHIKSVCDRLNKEQNGCGKKWSPHMVELALWTHNIVSELQPHLLGKEPNLTAPTNGAPLPSDESNLEPPSTNGNGKLGTDSVNEDTTTSCTEDSMDAKATSPATPASPSDNSDSAFSTPRAKRQIEEASSAEENSLGDSSDVPVPPVAKKLREATH
ncbi:LOW QUALITY PROTEIN: protein amun [Aphomia sociella]